MPAWIFAVIGIVANVINLISAMINNGSPFSNIISLVFSILVFIAANTIKNNG